MHVLMFSPCGNTSTTLHDRKRRNCLYDPI